MWAPERSAFLHVLLLFGLCIAVTCSGVLDGVWTELGYEHYAERPVAWLPRSLAMPANSLVNLGYSALGARWLRQEAAGDGYYKDAFAWMVLAYGPVQWARIAWQAQRPAVLDQWLTLPIFAWVPVWAAYLLAGEEDGRIRRLPRALAVEAASIASYGLALAHRRGFELALGCHIAAAVLAGLAAQRRLGDAVSRRHLLQAVASCVGFVVLKLLDLPLGRLDPGLGLLSGPLSGHFLSKLCDLLQIHYSLCFLQHLARRKNLKHK
ncbi:transmembrane protein 187 [Pristis pectinata]|uniref:transmembrane protein 187 n=1 Tax=Pristis pectinata TaxID=685728 RepID=UPI00223E427B|nr:transmembrane protein 187 [Pristis pectinata]